MIRVSVLYPNKEDGRFDFDCYLQKHIPFLQEKLESFGMIRAEIDKGIASGTGGSPQFIAVAHLIFDSVDQVQAGMESAGGELMNDIPNYTDINPEIQISEMIE